MPNASLLKIEYWNNSLLASERPGQRANRYIIFDVDQGGLNNIRLVFEYVAVLALVTGRTLVLPPKSSWYLLNHGPLPEQHQGGTTEFSDLFDLRALRQALIVIDTHEFVREAASHLQIPEKFRNLVKWRQNLSDYNADWQSWLLDNGEIPGWNPHDTMICLPSIDAARCGPHMESEYLDGRQPVELSAWMSASPMLYFPSTADYRSLGPVATMLGSRDDFLPKLARGFIRNHLRFHRDIFALAARAIKALGLHEFDALQVRRNDFQYPETLTSSTGISQNIGSLFDHQLPIYVATDETRNEIFKQLAMDLNAPRIISWSDVEERLDEVVPFIWIGPVEQIICAAARRFVGTDLSTFTAYIHRLRGYMGAVDTRRYFHSHEYPEVPDSSFEQSLMGRNYLRENPLYWTSVKGSRC